MTISSSPGTRADRLPLVHATRPLRGSSACSAQTSRRSSSGMDELRRVAQAVHDVVAAAAEVVVQPGVVREQPVVGVGARARRGRTRRGRRGPSPRPRRGCRDARRRRPRRASPSRAPGPARSAIRCSGIRQHVGVDLHHERVLDQPAGGERARAPPAPRARTSRGSCGCRTRSPRPARGRRPRARVASVSPTISPLSSWSTSTERLPLFQSSAISPCAPTACCAARRGARRARSCVRPAARSSTNQPKMSPTPLWPAS